METRTILVLLGLLATAVAAADTWTWTDEEGVVHYSDRPQPGATRIIIEEPNSSQSLSQRRGAAGDGADDATDDGAAATRYESFEVT